MRTHTALAKVLEHQGRRQDWLARTTGYSLVYVHYLCTGTKPMTVPAADRIARALGVLPESLFTRTDGREVTPATTEDTNAA